MFPRPLKAVLALIAVCVGYGATAQTESRKVASQHYTWKNVQIVGGGFVDVIIFHPEEKGLRYARTDIGGAYRWNDKSKRWEPVLDWVSYPDMNLMGVESIAVDPSDPDRVYLACGTYINPRTPNGAILRSRDRGRSFQRTYVLFKFGGNETGRGNGERRGRSQRLSDLVAREGLDSKSGGTSAQWANESFRLAHAVWVSEGSDMDESYYRRNRPTLDRQLALAECVWHTCSTKR